MEGWLQPEADRPWAGSGKLLKKQILKNMFYVYIIYSNKRKIIYKGKTDDIKRRLAEHNNGNVYSTKSGRPWKLIYYESFLNKADAAIEEKFLKSGKGRERLKYLLGNTLKQIK